MDDKNSRIVKMTIWGLVLILLCIFLFFALKGKAWSGTLSRVPYGLQVQQQSAPGTPPSDYGYFYVADLGGTMTLYFKDDQGTATNLLSPTATVNWDDIGNPDEAQTITFSTYATILTGAKTDGDQFTYRNTSAFGDYSIFKIQQLTGNATDGTCLTVTAADTDVDGVIISNTAADLSSSNYLLTLGLTDDGDAQGIFLRCLDHASADTKFQVGVDGATTIAGTAAGTDALTLTAGNITVTDGALTLTSATNGDLTVGDDATISGDCGVTGALTVGGGAAITGALTATSIEAGTIKQNAFAPASAGATLTVNGDGAGGVNIGSVSTGGITLGATTTVADGKNVTIGEGSLTIDNDVNESALVIESSSTTTGSPIQVTASTTTGSCVSVTADDLGSGGKMIYLDSDNTAADNYYFYLYNGTAADFTVGRYGGTVITGLASTDVLTVTTGDVQIDDGKVNIDTNEDDTTSIIRNQGVTTGPVFTVQEAAAAADNPVIFIDQDATTAASYGLQIDTEGGTAIDLLDLIATGDGILVSTAASYTGQIFKVDDTLVGTSGEGCAIDIRSSANIATGASLVRLDADTGTLVAATDGFILSVDDDSVAQATSYAVKIDSASNEALHVATGKALFDELTTFTSGIDADGDLDIDFSANTEECSIVGAAEYAADGAQITIENTDADITGGNMYLMRLRYTDDGQTNADYMVMEDNNGDDKVTISNDGDILTAGTLTVNGTQIIGDGATEMVGVKHDVVDGAAVNPYAVTIAMSGTVFYNTQAIEFDLPEASTAIDTEYTFVVGHASNLDIDPEASDKILGLCDAAGDKARSTTVGDTITLIALDATNWVVKSIYPESTDWADAN